MEHRLVKRRIAAAVLLFSFALAALCVRYLPARHTQHELGDPVERIGLSGFFAAEADGTAVVRWSRSDARLRLPLVDRRGAQSVTLVMRGNQPTAQPLGISLDRMAVTATITPALRTYHLLTPPTMDRSLDVVLHDTPSAATHDPRRIAVDRLTIVGRDGWPPLWDLLSLLIVALLPVVLLGLTIRLPFDWSLVPSVLLVGSYLALPATDVPGLLAIGPLVTLIIAGIALLAPARQYAPLVLVTLAGAVLRGYGLGWGAGYLFHPDEQALARQSGSEPIHQLIIWTAQWAARVSGNIAWIDPWGIVLLGRVGSVLIGMALVVVVYLLGRQLLRPRWALLSAAYVAFVPVLVQQSHVATPVLFNALLVALLMLSSTRVAVAGRLRDSIACGIWSGSVLALCPQGGILWIAPVAAHLVMRQQPRRLSALGTAIGLALVCGALLDWRFGAIGTSAAASTGLAPAAASLSDAAGVAQQLSLAETYGHALFNILLWSLGPLLMQLSIVGWAFGMAQSLQDSRYRAWLPLLWSIGVYFAIAVHGSDRVQSLVLLVPLLCVTAALLLQTFAQRLRHAFGQRTVRLLAGTGLCLVLMTSLGLVNMYRSLDPRIAASRWLIAHVSPGKQVLHDPSMPEHLPLGVTHTYRSTALPEPLASDDLAARTQSIARLTEAQYLVLAGDRGDLILDQRMRRDPAMTCYYQAIFDGRLGFVPRASFAAQPHIGTWTIDDTWVDPALRMYDHPQVRIFERVATPTAQAVDLILSCAGA